MRPMSLPLLWSALLCLGMASAPAQSQTAG